VYRSPERGGKPRRCVKVTGAGLNTLRESRKVLDRMWKGLDPKLRGPSASARCNRNVVTFLVQKRR